MRQNGDPIMSKTNMLCDLSVLLNESSVEQFFVIRLLTLLGYEDSHIKTKASVEELSVSKGSAKCKYRPDYVIMLKSKPRIVIDAKDPKENLNNWTGQCGSYCLELNKRFKGEDPVELYILSNGVETRLYKWNESEPIVSLMFDDFTLNSSKYKKLLTFVSRTSFSSKYINHTKDKPKAKSKDTEGMHRFEKKGIDEINNLFTWCHQYIYKKDNMSQAAAFMEFVKLIFLKLLSDKKVHKDFTLESLGQKYEVPANAVQFSLAWILSLEDKTLNPVSDISFKQLRDDLEDKIHQNKKKRIFDQDEQLVLSNETIKGVVGKLEHVDLYSIDSDLNGRLFETFLNATMRGKDLGQYFTPRSVVKLMLRLADIKMGFNADDIPVIVDPCCGSGGFLIEALWEMWGNINKNGALSNIQKQELLDAVAHNKLVGIDIGKEPPIARIARINMYLHGDGGSRIYQADGLDKDCKVDAMLDAEKKKEVAELRQLLQKSGCADFIITNPPFSKVYETKHEPERQILSGYKIAHAGSGTTLKLKSSVRTSVLFIERYHDLLKDKGRVIAIVDDSILGGDDYVEVRNLIRKLYIIESVVSLPGDAFQRSKARVKTSIISLRKRTSEHEEQPSVFMFYATSIGLDDSPRQRSTPADKENRILADKEVKSISTMWNEFKKGNYSCEYVVEGTKLTNRLDVKSCLPKPRRLVSTWKEAGKDIFALRDLVEVYDEDKLDEDDVIITESCEDNVTLLRVKYDGVAEKGEEKRACEVEYPVLLRVHTGDIVISNINAVHGAIAVVPLDLDGCVVSNEYTICKVINGIDPYLIWLLARSPESRSDLLLLASGMGRTRVKWENARDLAVALPDSPVTNNALSLIYESIKLQKLAYEKRKEAENLVYQNLNLDNKEAWAVIKAFKPPK